MRPQACCRFSMDDFPGVLLLRLYPAEPGKPTAEGSGESRIAAAVDRIGQHAARRTRAGNHFQAALSDQIRNDDMGRHQQGLAGRDRRQGQIIGSSCRPS